MYTVSRPIYVHSSERAISCPYAVRLCLCPVIHCRRQTLERFTRNLHVLMSVDCRCVVRRRHCTRSGNHGAHVVAPVARSHPISSHTTTLLSDRSPLDTHSSRLQRGHSVNAGSVSIIAFTSLLRLTDFGFPPTSPRNYHSCLHLISKEIIEIKNC